MSTPEKDLKRLNLLAIFHNILGGIVGFLSCYVLIFVAVGVGLLTLEAPEGKEGFSAFLSWIAIVGGLLCSVLGWGLAICIFLAARNLMRKRKYWFCFVMACVECALALFMAMYRLLPQMLGFDNVLPLMILILGILTIITLRKESVKAAFEQSACPIPAGEKRE